MDEIQNHFSLIHLLPGNAITKSGFRSHRDLSMLISSGFENVPSRAGVARRVASTDKIWYHCRLGSWNQDGGTKLSHPLEPSWHVGRPLVGLLCYCAPERHPCCGESRCTHAFPYDCDCTIRCRRLTRGVVSKTPPSNRGAVDKRATPFEKEDWSAKRGKGGLRLPMQLHANRAIA